ncbi:long-chain fatty acid--CoA ligase [Lichenibacterium minor]|uniref:3-methylmercaptopropionyl-CoA ligase n=1 Tax=Lichenibacterium minor TaxID=2316528 RepID=A0A4V1RUA8_9HYPH|nr:class I adenylate-forming enzyme family protein [Lichenibacterium minor]RYC30504.1 long-chain fatty acid--CoA ligase [Lichenibacterium minor]
MTVPPAWPAVSFAEATAALTRPGSSFAVADAVVRGRPTRVWTHAPPTLRDLFLQARSFGDLPFLVYRDERASFDGFARAALVLAHALVDAGVRKGDRVAIATRNLPEWPVCYHAALLAGAVATPLNAWWTGPELVYALQDSGAVALVADGERLDRLAPHLAELPELRRVLVTRPAGAVADPRVAPLADLVGPTASWSSLPERPLPDVAIDPEDDATIFYTSGTTGRPKGAVGTHRASAATVMAHGYSVARSCLRRGEPVPVPDPSAPQRASLLAIPLFHVTGCHSTLGTAMWRGQKLVMMHRWDVDAGLDLIAAEGCTGAGGVPSIAWELASRAAATGRVLPTLEGVFYGGAPAAADLVRALKASFPAAQPATGWGMTETSATFTHHIGEDYEHRPESCGPPLPVCDARVVDVDGSALAPGIVGELQVRGPNLVRGYWNKPAATAERFADGWLRTGDLARIDAEGFIVIVDRITDMLIRGGENIYCVEVENALFAHPAVIDAAVLAVPHPTLGEEPGAVVTLAEGAAADEAELRRFVGQRIAAYKVPVRIVFWDGMLPRNPAGKILRRELKGALAR